MPRSLRFVACALLWLSGVQALSAQDSTARSRDTLRRARPKITSQVLLDSAAFHDLPILDIRGLLILQPGVTESNDPRGPSLRGGDPGETAVFVDGALIQGGGSPSPLLVGINSVARATLTTGASGADAWDVGAGALA